MPRVQFSVINAEKILKVVYINPRAVNAIEGYGPGTKVHVAGVPYPFMVQLGANEVEERLQKAEAEEG